MPRTYPYKVQGSKFYGPFDGFVVYHQGFETRPKCLPDKGKGFPGLRHLLETLRKRLERFTLTFTPNETSINKVGKAYLVKLSEPAVRQFRASKWTASRELGLRLASQFCARQFRDVFDGDFGVGVYQRGMFADVLNDPKFDPRTIAPHDRAALTRFVLGEQFASADSSLDIPTAYKTKQDVQLIYVRRLLAEFDRLRAESHDEGFWQQYFERNILFFQESYIRRLPRMNVQVVGTSFPDFTVLTSDLFLDVIEIKKPSTDLLRHDGSRGNYYWSTEVAKAISQVENYLNSVVVHGNAIRSTLWDSERIELRVVKPRGLVIAGDSAEFSKTKQADDFRRLNEGLKHVQIIPYDELATRLRNTMESIERLQRTSEAGDAASPASASRRRPPAVGATRR